MGQSRWGSQCGAIKQYMRNARQSAPEYVAWANMLARCRNPNKPEYKNYGGRGICVCERWRSYDNFLTDMGTRPSPKHTLERKDNSRRYGPGNCVWATRMEQLRNKRTNLNFILFGYEMCAKDWCRFFGVGYSTFLRRIKNGMAPLQALRTPPQAGWKKKFHQTTQQKGQT